VEQAVDVFNYYGQGKGAMPDEVTRKR